MSYKCVVCGYNEVEYEGNMCDVCAIGQDPYITAMQGNTQSTSPNYGQANPQMNNVGSYANGSGKSRKVLLGGGASIANTDPYGNNMVPSMEPKSDVKVYQAGEVPASSQSASVINNGGGRATNNTATKSNQPISQGITKNITVDEQKKSFLGKWFRTLFSGVPFTLDNDTTMFQVFPDYSGTSLNSAGNACDQVIVYGKLNAGAVSENNDVEVYGHRDANNNIIAKMIRNKASGTTITPDRTLSVVVVWLISVIVFALAFMAITFLGVEGIIWAVVILLCFTNLPLVLKIIGVVFGFFISIIKKVM